MAVLDWLEKTRPREEYILILDADMIMRRPFDPVRLGVRPGAQPYESGMGGFLYPNAESPCCGAAIWQHHHTAKSSTSMATRGAAVPGHCQRCVLWWCAFALPAHRLLQHLSKRHQGERAGVPGWAVSGFYGYLKGVSNELALRHVPRIEPRRDTLAGPLGRRGDQARA